MYIYEVNDFRYFVIIFPWKWPWSFIWTDLDPLQPRIALHLKNLDLLHPRMLCAKFGWNWISGFGEEDEHVKSFHDNDANDNDDGSQQTDRQIRKADLRNRLRLANKDRVTLLWGIIRRKYDTGHDRHMSLKQVVTVPLPNACHATFVNVTDPSDENTEVPCHRWCCTLKNTGQWPWFDYCLNSLLTSKQVSYM